MNKESIPSRAYIAFKNEDQVATFSREYDGHLFRDKAGRSVWVFNRIVGFLFCYAVIPHPEIHIDGSPTFCFFLGGGTSGNESHAVVEFAPFQKVPAEKKKVDARNNTIDKGELRGQGKTLLSRNL